MLISPLDEASVTPGVPGRNRQDQRIHYPMPVKGTVKLPTGGRNAPVKANRQPCSQAPVINSLTFIGSIANRQAYVGGLACWTYRRPIRFTGDDDIC
jgi:hypothetical protein